MNAKRRTLAVLAAVIAVLGLALWALNRSTAAEEAASSAAVEGTIPLCSFSAADLSRITYTYNGQTLTLDDADGSWTLAEDSGLPSGRERLQYHGHSAFVPPCKAAAGRAGRGGLRP